MFNVVKMRKVGMYIVEITKIATRCTVIFSKNITDEVKQNKWQKRLIIKVIILKF
jgi:hypothetical protein